MYITNKTLHIKFSSVLLSLFFLTVFTLPVAAVDLPFDPNLYDFLIYVPEGGQDSIVEAMEYILGRELDDQNEIRDYYNEVTQEDLATHDILIVGWNYDGDTRGLDDETLASGITGRVILSGHDADYHTVNGPRSAEVFLVQAIDWVLKGGGTGMITLGCTDAFPYLPEDWDVTVYVDDDEDVNEFTLYGLYSGVYDGLEPDDFDNWGTSYHDIFDIEQGSAFVPFELGGDDGSDIITIASNKFKLPYFNIYKDDNDVNCVYPFNESAGNWLYYNIAWDANGYADSNVVVTDFLPIEVDEPDYISDGGQYDSNMHKVTWTIGSVTGNDSGNFQIRCSVNEYACPGRVINNRAEIEGDEYIFWSMVHTNVCCWCPSVIYVDEDANGYNVGTSWDHAYTYLQDALERAGDCDCNEIWVAEGTYKPTTDTSGYDANFALADGVYVYGGFAGNETSLSQRNWIENETILEGDLDGDEDGDVEYLVKALNLNQSTVLDGFIIRHGDEAAVQCYSSSTEIGNCIIEDSGRGVYCTNSSSVKITNTSILGCNASGVYSDGSDITLTDCHIADNTYEEGGVCGISCSGSDLTVKDCAIEKNDRSGISIYNPSSATITNNRIRKNGFHGIECSTVNSEIDIKNNWIHTNGTYSTAGNGIYIGSGSSTSTIRNNTIVDNNDCGIEIWGGALASISNCILWANNSGGDQLSNCTATYSCIQNDDSGTNIKDDPCFINPTDPNDYYLGPNSLCIDEGDTGPNYDGETDIDGEQRELDGDGDCDERVDMGADEYYWSRADYNKDEIVNFLDYAIFSNAWLTENEDISLDCDNDVNMADLYQFRKDWLWRAGWSKSYSYGCTGFGGDGGFGKSAQFEQEIEQQQSDLPSLDTEGLVEFLEAIWEQDEGLKDYFTEEQWQQFVESVKSD